MYILPFTVCSSNDKFYYALCEEIFMNLPLDYNALSFFVTKCSHSSQTIPQLSLLPEVPVVTFTVFSFCITIHTALQSNQTFSSLGKPI